jgi:tRNA(fMet)-specific endonuclease VapC
MNDGRRIRYVLDTDTISAIQRRHPTVSERLAGTDPGIVATTVVTLYEQFRGRLAVVSRARNDMALQAAFGLLLETRRHLCDIEVLPFDAAAAGIFRSLLGQRLRVGTQDLRIAAITLANDATLVTSNRRDFERVLGLRIEDWTIEEPV